MKTSEEIGRDVYNLYSFLAGHPDETHLSPELSRIVRESVSGVYWADDVPDAEMGRLDKDQLVRVGVLFREKVGPIVETVCREVRSRPDSVTITVSGVAGIVMESLGLDGFSGEAVQMFVMLVSNEVVRNLREDGCV